MHTARAVAAPACTRCADACAGSRLHVCCALQVARKAGADKVPVKAPSYRAVREELLAEAVQRVDERLLPAWERNLPRTGCTICCDGWDATDSRPLLNVLAVNPKGARFLFSVDTTGWRKDAEYIADVLERAIKLVGQDNVVQVVTDNAKACVNAGAIIEKRCEAFMGARGSLNKGLLQGFCYMCDTCVQAQLWGTGTHLSEPRHWSRTLTPLLAPTGSRTSRGRHALHTRAT